MLAPAIILSLLSVGTTAQTYGSKSFVLFAFPSPGYDLPNSVSHTHLTPLPLGNGDYIITSSRSHDAVFFANATTSDMATWTTNWDRPGSVSYGLSLDDADGGTARLKPGDTGARGITPTRNSAPNFQHDVLWRFCEVAMDEYGGARVNVLKGKWRRTAEEKEGEENCVRVEVLPYNAKRPSGATADVSNAQMISCYIGGDD